MSLLKTMVAKAAEMFVRRLDADPTDLWVRIEVDDPERTTFQASIKKSEVADFLRKSREHNVTVVVGAGMRRNEVFSIKPDWWIS